MNTKLTFVDNSDELGYDDSREMDLRGDHMVSIRPRQMQDEEIVSHLKTVLEACDADELKSKKFVGLLNDHIPYNQGLKIRLELIAKNGYIDELKKMKRANDPIKKIDKMAQDFSKTYGFRHEESIATFNLLARALSLKAIAQRETTLRIVDAVQSSQGNFSKKHLPEEKEVKIPMTPIKKRFIRNKANLWLYLLYLVALPVAFYVLLEHFGITEEVLSQVKSVVTFPIHLNRWFIGALIVTFFMVMLPFAANWTFKFNLLGIYPMIMLLVQVVLFSIQPAMPQFYSVAQVVLGGILMLSFAILAFYAMRLPKGANEYTAQRALLPYYLSGAIWLMGQYVFYGKLI